MSDAPPIIGQVLGTQEATPLQFWFWVRPEASVQLDDFIVVKMQKPDGGFLEYFGVVDLVRKTHEGVSFESDIQNVSDGILPAQVSYSARVLVTRVDPEEFIPPHPGEAVYKAEGLSLHKALYQDHMEAKLAAGVLRSGDPVYLNFDFLNGKNGAHINISGVSGVATKTSYALFLLYSIFNSHTLGAERANSKAVIFNVKGEDLLFLDRSNGQFSEKEQRYAQARTLKADRYSICGLPQTPFRDVQFLAPPKVLSDPQMIVPNVEQRQSGIETYFWTLRDFCLSRFLPYCFTDREASLNLGFLISQIEEKLYRLAHSQPESSDLRVQDWQPEGSTELFGPAPQFDELGYQKLTTFEQLVDYVEYKLLEQNGGEGDKRWVGKQNQGTLQAFIRRFRGVIKHLSPLIRGGISVTLAKKHRPNILKPSAQLSVIDIHSLNAHAQTFVVGVILKELFEEKERMGRRNSIFVVLDELNKYAPREGQSPIKDVLLDIAERGRSLGIILIGAQQTASEVERRITSNAAIRVVGRLDAAEAERPEYRFLPSSYRLRASLLQPGTMILHQPDVPTPVMVSFPFPAWATRNDEDAVHGLKDGPEAKEIAGKWLLDD